MRISEDVIRYLTLKLEERKAPPEPVAAEAEG
jgi:ribosomal protein S6